MDELLLLTSPSLHFKRTGSLLQFLLTSSPLNTDGRALTIDEPFTATQTDELLPTAHIDEPSTALQTDGLLLTILIKELSPQHRWTSSYYLRLTSPSLHLKTDGLLLTILTIYVDEPLLHLRQTGSFLY